MAGPLNGFDLARVLKAQHPTIRVILATGYSEAAGQAAGMFTVLRKPYNMVGLNAALAKVGATAERKIIDFEAAKRGLPQ